MVVFVLSGFRKKIRIFIFILNNANVGGFGYFYFYIDKKNKIIFFSIPKIKYFVVNKKNH